MALAWNVMNIFLAHLFQAGMEELAQLLRGGGLTRPDTLMVALGATGHFLLIAGCIAEFAKLRPESGSGLASVWMDCWRSVTWR